MTPLEILEAHTVKRPWSEASRMRCKCGEVVTAETEGQLYSLHRAHVAEVLDKHMQERMAHERAHTIQMIRDQSDWTQDETDEYGRVTLEGYLTIGTRELDKIEDGTGADRMCFSLADWEKREEQVRAEAKAEALNESATYAVEWVGIVGDGALVDLKTESEYADTAEWLRARANQYKENQ